jgi:hypothetical protein
MVDHTVILRRLSPVKGEARSVLILERTDQEFIPSVLDELGREDGIARIDQTEARASAGGLLKLFQPVHRTFHVALFEVACATTGEPRLDPERIESAGLVIRRVSFDKNRRRRVEGWRQKENLLRGWVAFRDEEDERLDPDPARRPARLKSGNAEIDRRLAATLNLSSTLGESVSPLFVAPPDVCKAARRTILYGVISLTSTEISEVAGTPPPYEDPDVKAELRKHMPRFLQSGGSRTMPRAGAQLDHSAASSSSLASDAPLREFVLMLRQLAIEFDAFGKTQQARELFAELNAIKLAFASNATRPAGDFLKEAAAILVELEGKGKNPPPKITMPLAWPAISASQADRIYGLAVAAIKTQLDLVAPREGRFEAPGATYQLRAFVRVKRADGCPPITVWTNQYSQPFTIAPWYDAGNARPVQVSLPDLTDRSLLKSLKPNVAFNVPKNLFNMLQNNDPKKMVDGEGSDSTAGLSLDWICGFSIPIITLCAFIVLNIFLQLFDIIFRWLLFIKICIPFPRPK